MHNPSRYSDCTLNSTEILESSKIKGTEHNNDRLLQFYVFAILGNIEDASGVHKCIIMMYIVLHYCFSV